MNRDRLLLLLTMIVAGSLFLTPARRDLFVGDETKYGRILWEMRDSGELLLPRLEGRPYSHKPPLHFWIVYALTFIFGTGSTWPFMLPSLVSFLLMLVLTRKMARELLGGSGMMAVFIFSTFYLSWGLAQTARMDMMFVLLTSYAVLHVYRSSLLSPPSSLLRAGGLVGLAILVKGPMALVIVASLLLIESLLHRTAGVPPAAGRRPAVPMRNYLLALILAAGIPLLWLIPALQAGGSEYAREILVTQNINRAVNAWVHRQPPWWYLQRLPLTFFPWFLLAIVTMIETLRPEERRAKSEERIAKSEERRAKSEERRAKSEKGRAESEERGVASEERSPLLASRSSLLAPRSSLLAPRSSLFCVSWFFAVLIPFSLLSSKLDVYMLPALVPIALLCGYFIDQHSHSPTLALSHSRLVGVAVIGNRVILLFLALLFVTIPLLAPRFTDQLPELEMLRRPLAAGLFWSTAAVAVAAFIWSLRAGDPLYRSVLALGLGAIYPLVYLATFLMPMVNETSSTRPLVRALMKQTTEGRQIGLWQSPHLWTADMPASYREVEYLSRDRLRQPGPVPLVIATRADRAHHLGRELLEQYRKVDHFRMRGKPFDVYLRR